ncbi:MAG: PadR family transcriptional regulator [Anaerolineae bacterium]|jgi:PadR family transcriptional regulator, regulatory protein PadR|nr:PadR family transcriptional regulator [Anaerolineae bacterium]MBT7072083.1 PadR family transcriptional regulator [Anaerolineae bacterium]MBT7324287.1 PadR family transcriptional regulator [Anaerolineae bacterium]
MVEENTPTKKFQKEMNSGTASLVLLSVLSQTKEPMYGYQIAKFLDDNRQDAPAMKQGALYPVLRSLEKNELLSSNVEPSVSGPPRRYYTITDEGRKTLTLWAEIWSQMKNFVDNILEGESHV